MRRVVPCSTLRLLFVPPVVEEEPEGKGRFGVMGVRAGPSSGGVSDDSVEEGDAGRGGEFIGAKASCDTRRSARMAVR